MRPRSIAREVGRPDRSETWTPDELDRIGDADELQIAPRAQTARCAARCRSGSCASATSSTCAPGAATTAAGTAPPRPAAKDTSGRRRRARTSPYVAADDEVNDAVDAAFREKYGRYTGYVEPMVAPQARATTLRLVPRSEAGA